MSEFGGLSIALSSLQTQQRALEIAANNVANAGTAGYSRQAANMTTVGGSVPAIFSTSTGDGSGVTISSVTRFRDAFMEIQAGLLHGSLASLDQTNATMTQIQNVYGEPSDNGIGAQLCELLVFVGRGGQQPRRPGVAHGADPRGDDARAELQHRGLVAQAAPEQRNHAARQRRRRR